MNFAETCHHKQIDNREVWVYVSYSGHFSTCSYTYAQKPLHTSVADPETYERGGGRNMNYKSLRLATIYFMTTFDRSGGGHGPLGPPPWIRYCNYYGRITLYVSIVGKIDKHTDSEH